MLSDDDFIIPDGDYIEGIYNYCDSWCERCLYTARCMNFALQVPIEKEAAARKRHEKSLEENKGFWQQIDQTIEEAAELFDEEFPLSKSLTESILSDDEDDIEEAMQQFEELREQSSSHELVQIATNYMKQVHNWFDKVKGTLQENYSGENDEYSCSYPGLDDQDQKRLTESCELIRWYEMMISVKTRRAISGRLDEQNNPEDFEGFPKDSDGSAMVALKGINASISGWTFLFKTIKPEKDTIKTFLHSLWYLKTEMENKFPAALTFVWPPEEREEQ